MKGIFIMTKKIKLPLNNSNKEDTKEINSNQLISTDELSEYIQNVQLTTSNKIKDLLVENFSLKSEDVVSMIIEIISNIISNKNCEEDMNDYVFSLKGAINISISEMLSDDFIHNLHEIFNVNPNKPLNIDLLRLYSDASLIAACEFLVDTISHFVYTTFLTQNNLTSADWVKSSNFDIITEQQLLNIICCFAHHIISDLTSGFYYAKEMLALEEKLK
jgi:hypothetical protein